ncbi:hypothetical protein PoB_004449600 [Plakobranchus ocellatus]|uniref:Peptidase S1 domain-containing protein n=1 Tax=Plakobranchus ocellatus TaxID=259542 RepID=A0AAV4BC32_9GAST|nr:hypothetical protein PoB_004449600 [Plakobranchus ocellatus]
MEVQAVLTATSAKHCVSFSVLIPCCVCVCEYTHCGASQPYIVFATKAMFNSINTQTVFERNVRKKGVYRKIRKSARAEANRHLVLVKLNQSACPVQGDSGGTVDSASILGFSGTFFVAGSIHRMAPTP